MLKKKYTILLIIIIIIIIVIFFSLSVYTLELRSFSDDELIFKRKVQIGDKFTLKYTHSVSLTPVWEIFIIDDNYQIVLIETDFLDHGAGLPYAAFGQEKFINEKDKIRIINMCRTIHTPFYYRIGAIRENILYFKDKEINLSTLVGDKLLTLDIYKKNLFNYFLGGIL
ncbi:MAG TPA: DUF1850 domain-containing protein [Candidatus Atribacteria bacterium]|nr:DUF1850 domain-containing protein [Candidatus Atribacteria bacterium]